MPPKTTQTSAFANRWAVNGWTFGFGDIGMTPILTIHHMNHVNDPF